jgi:hypothetical protein
VSEQLRRDQRRGQRAWIDDDERLLRARAHLVDGARHQLLAGARLTLDQHGDGRLGQPLDGAAHLLHRRARGHQPRDVGWWRRRLQGGDGGVEQGQHGASDPDARPDRDDRLVDPHVADEGAVAAAQILDQHAVFAAELEVIVADGRVGEGQLVRGRRAYAEPIAVVLHDAIPVGTFDDAHAQPPYGRLHTLEMELGRLAHARGSSSSTGGVSENRASVLPPG